ncbi:uncharacterized protein TNCV_1018911 [Trichonephila clavipes]|nr:uncharacterized protein TNCV_1018911 [Trichonephila clavipes]
MSSQIKITKSAHNHFVFEEDAIVKYVLFNEKKKKSIDEKGDELFWNVNHEMTRMTWGCGSPVVKISDHGRHVMSSSPVPSKTRRVGQRCTLNLSRAETSSRWCGVVVRRGGASSGVVHVT